MRKVVPPRYIQVHTVQKKPNRLVTGKGAKVVIHTKHAPKQLQMEGHFDMRKCVECGVYSKMSDAMQVEARDQSRV